MPSPHVQTVNSSLDQHDNIDNPTIDLVLTNPCKRRRASDYFFLEDLEDISSDTDETSHLSTSTGMFTYHVITTYHLPLRPNLLHHPLAGIVNTTPNTNPISFEEVRDCRTTHSRSPTIMPLGTTYLTHVCLTPHLNSHPIHHHCIISFCRY